MLQKKSANIQNLKIKINKIIYIIYFIRDTNLLLPTPELNHSLSEQAGQDTLQRAD
jgi:hypothetical protein